MTVPVPTSTPSTSAWSVYDWIDRSDKATTDADGSATITLPTLGDSERWQLTHMVAGCLSTAVPKLRLYLDDAADGNLRDGTDDGRFGVSDWSPGLWIPPNRALIAVWTGADPGVRAILNTQATVWRKS